MQCDAPTPHNPSRPSPTGDCIGKAFARPPLRRHLEVIRDDEGGSTSGTRRERRQPQGGLTTDGAADTLRRVGARIVKVSLSRMRTTYELSGRTWW